MSRCPENSRKYGTNKAACTARHSSRRKAITSHQLNARACFLSYSITDSPNKVQLMNSLVSKTQEQTPKLGFQLEQFSRYGRFLIGTFTDGGHFEFCLVSTLSKRQTVVNFLFWHTDTLTYPNPLKNKIKQFFLTFSLI